MSAVRFLVAAVLVRLPILELLAALVLIAVGVGLLAGLGAALVTLGALDLVLLVGPDVLRALRRTS